MKLNNHLLIHLVTLELNTGRIVCEIQKLKDLLKNAQILLKLVKLWGKRNFKMDNGDIK